MQWECPNCNTEEPSGIRATPRDNTSLPTHAPVSILKVKACCTAGLLNGYAPLLLTTIEDNPCLCDRARQYLFS